MKSRGFCVNINPDKNEEQSGIGLSTYCKGHHKCHLTQDRFLTNVIEL